MLRSLCAIATGLLLAAQAPAAAPDRFVGTIHPETPGPTLSRHLFGQFAEHLGSGIYGGVWVGPDSPIPNTRGIRKDVVAALRALKVPNVRWPGGCFADYYHWRSGVGPRRAVTLNPDWGGVTEPNTFGTHEYMDFVEQIGSAPYISVNVGSGTPQEAADWLEYMTTALPTTLAQERAANGRAEPWQVPILGLGNESWDCGGNMTPEYYASQMKIYSRFARNHHPAQQQPASRMLRIAVGPGGGEPRFTAWTETVMKAWSERQWSWDIDGLSLHHYTVVDWEKKHAATGFGEKEYAEILQATLAMDGLISRHSAIMDRYDPGKKLALAVDEWGAWYAPAAGTNPGFLVQQNSLRDAVLAALNLNIFARHADRVRMANIAQMVNVLQAMILTDGPRMLLTPTYHVFRMYVPFQEASFVPITLDAGSWRHDGIELPRVDALAAKDAAGRLLVSLTNLDPARPATVELPLTGASYASVSAETLTGPRVDSVNTFEAPEVVAPKPLKAVLAGGRLQVTLEPKSVSVITLAPAAGAALLPHPDPLAALASRDPALAANKRLVFDMWRTIVDAGHIEAADDMLAEGYIQHSPVLRTGRAAFKQIFSVVPRRPIPALVEPPLVASLAERDLVVMSLLERVPAREGSPGYATSHFNLFRVENGRLAEHWHSVQTPPGPDVPLPEDGGPQPVVGARGEAQRALLEAPDPRLARNKRLVFDLWRELVDAGHAERAAHYFGAAFVDHRVESASGLEGVRRRFSSRPKRAIEPSIRAPVVAMVAEGDLVALVTMKELPHPHRAGRSYTTTWFDLFRIGDGRVLEHWDAAAPGEAAGDSRW